MISLWIHSASIRSDCPDDELITESAGRLPAAVRVLDLPLAHLTRLPPGDNLRDLRHHQIVVWSGSFCNQLLLQQAGWCRTCWMRQEPAVPDDVCVRCILWRFIVCCRATNRPSFSCLCYVCRLCTVHMFISSCETVRHRYTLSDPSCCSVEELALDWVLCKATCF
jgi:hypothetical protein